MNSLISIQDCGFTTLYTDYLHLSADRRVGFSVKFPFLMSMASVMVEHNSCGQCKNKHVRVDMRLCLSDNLTHMMRDHHHAQQKSNIIISVNDTLDVEHNYVNWMT